MKQKTFFARSGFVRSNEDEPPTCRTEALPGVRRGAFQPREAPEPALVSLNWCDLIATGVH